MVRSRATRSHAAITARADCFEPREFTANPGAPPGRTYAWLSLGLQSLGLQSLGLQSLGLQSLGLQLQGLGLQG